MRKLDALVAENAMGGFIEGDPERWSEKEEIWFWMHPRDGVLIGEPYHINVFREKNEPKMYSHSWRTFEPSTNISDAWLVVEAMENRELWFKLSNVIPNSDPIVYEVTFRGKGVMYYACEDTAPLAICRAAIREAE